MPQRQLKSLIDRLRHLADPADPDQPTDRDLLHRFCDQRDESAFAELVRRHGPMVLATCRRQLGDPQDAEDALQAVFLVLARKAAATGWRASIGGWLFVVAQRVARKARLNKELRQRRERETSVMRPEQVPPEDGDLRALLDAELERLPEKYRAPLVLCYLEGHTNEEAAQRLGWPKGTVQSYVARGRDLLRTRLTRNGLVLSASAMALLEGSAAAAPLPVSLLATTMRSVLACTGTPANGEVPTAITLLADSVEKSISGTRWKTLATILLLLGVGGAVSGAWLSWRPEPKSGSGLPQRSGAEPGEPRPRDLIVGRWQRENEVGAPAVVAIRSDGTFAEEGGKQSTGKYRFLTDNTMELTFDTPDRPNWTWNVKMTKDNLIIRDVKQRVTITYRRLVK